MNNIQQDIERLRGLTKDETVLDILTEAEAILKDSISKIDYAEEMIKALETGYEPFCTDFKDQ